MSKLVEIEASISRSTSGDSVILRMSAERGVKTYLDIWANDHERGAAMFVHTPAEAREYAQMLRGAADALLDFALSVEQPANFVAVDAPTSHTYRIETSIAVDGAAEVPA